MSWRYRKAWLSARRRANNLSGSVVFWKSKATELEQAYKRLCNVHDDERQRRKVSMGDLIPAPPAVDALGSHDRRNALRLTDENARLREALEVAQRRAVELEKQLEGHPS